MNSKTNTAKEDEMSIDIITGRTTLRLKNNELSDGMVTEERSYDLETQICLWLVNCYENHNPDEIHELEAHTPEAAEGLRQAKAMLS